MGWNTANEIFDPVCQEVIRQVEKADGIYPEDAARLLAVLISELQNGDWDTEDESLEKFKDYNYVVSAFADNDIYPRDDE